MAASRLSGASHTKLLIPVSSARILLLASGESKGRSTSAFALVTGLPLNRPKRSGRCLTRIRLDQIQFLLGHVSVQTTERYLGYKQRLQNVVNDRIGIEPN